MTTITKTQARDEIQRRADNKGKPKAEKVHASGPVTQLGSADLAAIANGTKAKAAAPAKAKPSGPSAKQVKARKRFAAEAKARKGTGAGGAEHTERRRLAFEAHRARKAAGEKVTLATVQAEFGTASASVMADMTDAEIAALG